ncbi:site-specific integrase [Streptomyces sp. NPDC050564]|uniref:site-specific integrase n=1 Tax=Streptomyces sp. NPDC050564 TaxID=3365631 RepID=UPI0037B69958
MPGWRVFWVPTKTFVGVRQISVLTGWDDLQSREERTGVHSGDPIMLSPDYRVDELLSEYLSRSSFVLLEHETKRNYTSDYRVFFDFLWGRGKLWTQATADDLLDFHDWRVRSPQNPGRVGGAKWNRELAALTRLYDWANRRRVRPGKPGAVADDRRAVRGDDLGPGRTGEECPDQQRALADPAGVSPVAGRRNARPHGSGLARCDLGQPLGGAQRRVRRTAVLLRHAPGGGSVAADRGSSTDQAGRRGRRYQLPRHPSLCPVRRPPGPAGAGTWTRSPRGYGGPGG